MPSDDISPSVNYRDSRVAGAIYAVPIAVARQKLDGTGLSPVAIGGYAIVHATWFDYGDSSIGAYREFSLGVMASVQALSFATIPNLLLGTASMGAFILALPVDLERARAGGVMHYGLPKTLLEFSLRWGKRALDATLLDQGQSVLDMRVPLQRGLPLWMRQLIIYSMRDAQLCTTRIATRWSAKFDLVGRPRLTVNAPSHPLGQLIIELGLESARALGVVHGPMSHAELPVPRR